MDYESLLLLMKRRRNIWKFKSDAVSQELVEKVIEAARWAPSAANSQPWEFIVEEVASSFGEMFAYYRFIEDRLER